MSNWNVNLTGVIVASGQPVPMMKWEGNKPTDTPQTNAEGVPLYKIPLLYKPEGAADYEKITVEVPSAKAPVTSQNQTPTTGNVSCNLRGLGQMDRPLYLAR